MLESKFLNRLCQLAGLGLAVTSLILTATFGASISIGMMFALGVISVMASYLPAIMIELGDSGRKWLLIPGIIVALLVTVIDVTTNASTTGVYKTTDVVQANVQQAKYVDRRDAVASAKDEVALFNKLIADLKTENPFATTVSADGLKGQIPAIEEAIRQEAKRGGCGPKCLALKEQLADVQKRIGVAEKLDEHTAKLEAARRGLEKAIAEASTSEQGESAVATQNFRLASLLTLSRAPSDDAVHWTDQWLMVVIGVVITFASQFFNALGFVGPRSGARLKERLVSPQKPIVSPVPVVPALASVPAVAAPERVVERVSEPGHTIHVKNGVDLLEALQAQLGRVRVAGAAAA